MTEVLRKQIDEYIPYNELESMDKKSFLQFIDAFKDDIWRRENLVGHVTASSWIVNKDNTKVLMVYHNLYNDWTWLGGHNDNDRDSLAVCKREVEEECGVSQMKVLSEDILGIDIIQVSRHIKHGKHISDHLHFNVTYFIEIDDKLKTSIKVDENSGVKWIKKENVCDYVKDEKMKKVYKRFMDKADDLYYSNSNSNLL